MKKNCLLIFILIIFLFTGVACNKGINKKDGYYIENKPLKIYTTFYPMYYIAGEITQEKADIVQMIPAGVEPHTWEPTLKTMAELKGSSMFIYNGAGMERWAEKIIENLRENNVKVVETSIGVDLIKSDGNNHDDCDPHTWVSPANLKIQAKNVLDALVDIDKPNEEYYKENYKILAAKLDKLNGDIKEASKQFKIKTIITSHEAFGYFAKEYGLMQIPIRGMSPEQEPSPAKLAEIVDICLENHVRYVFTEKFVNPKFSNIIADEIDGDVLTLNAAHGLSDDEISEGQDYITIMYDNLNSLEKALK